MGEIMGKNGNSGTKKKKNSNGQIAVSRCKRKTLEEGFQGCKRETGDSRRPQHVGGEPGRYTVWFCG